MTTPNPINDVTIAELINIQDSIRELQTNLSSLQSSVNTQQSLLLPDLSSFKTDIREIIKTIDDITQNDGTPILTYITSLIKDMIDDTNNIFYEKKSDGSINITNRLKAEFDILKAFAGHDDLKIKFSEKLNDMFSSGVYQKLTPEKKTELENVLNTLIP
jgi:hypothetical protein